MIEAIKKFARGYRAVGIKATTGMEGSGWIATFMKDGRVLGEAADYGDGGPVNIRFTNKQDEVELRELAKTIYTDFQYELAETFLGELVNYELAIKSLKTKAKKKLMKAEEGELDEHGVAKSYSSWNAPDSPELRAKILAKEPNTVFLNDQLASWEDIKKPRK
ncbi:hypothetical protein KTD15_06335 [Burkholderia multivorans]|uniref:hypothetical protein n=1 Tax=Burkholderia multivorans TaxID=87883 RepID=UPI001C22B6F6|nr:hypothetical protein [Burkholderia multivorans]MBU9118412.1 hypothetical protein [Burkholderia multivorans]MBU9434142.1 hypothetical protein [Burkholderia multivorans]MDN8018106.1 hypothetical protein [Burkholderia multivorans]